MRAVSGGAADSPWVAYRWHGLGAIRCHADTGHSQVAPFEREKTFEGLPGATVVWDRIFIYIYVPCLVLIVKRGFVICNKARSPWPTRSSYVRSGAAK